MSDRDIIIRIPEVLVYRVIISIMILGVVGLVSASYYPEMDYSTNTTTSTYYIGDEFGNGSGIVNVSHIHGDGSNITALNVSKVTAGSLSDTYVADNLTVSSGSLNASILDTGTIPSARVAGSYTGITGLGNVTVGTWSATAIIDAYIANILTITGGGLNASILDTGTVPSTRVSGSYTGITAVGNISTGTWSATAVTDTYIADTLTVTGGSLNGSIVDTGTVADEYLSTNVMWVNGSRNMTGSLVVPYINISNSTGTLGFWCNATTQDCMVNDRLYLFDEGGEYIQSNGSILYIFSGDGIYLQPTGDVYISSGGGIGLSLDRYIYFRDAQLQILSSADGQLDIDADVVLDMVAPTININASSSVNITGNVNMSYYNITEITDISCDGCVGPAEISDVDKDDIESDLNTFVDITSDNMTGTLGVGTISEGATSGVGTNFTDNATFYENLSTDGISEMTSGVGVIVDSVLLKDGVLEDSAYPNACLVDGSRALAGDWSIGSKNLTSINLLDLDAISQPASAEGMLYYDSTTKTLQYYNSTDWISLVNQTAIDHGVLEGLADDDHTQYLTESNASSTFILLSNTSISSDHGALTGRIDDDHTIYLKVDGTRNMTDDLQFNTDKGIVLDGGNITSSEDICIGSC